MTFNWSELDRDKIISIVYGCKNSLVNKSLTINKIHTILSSHIKEYLPIRIGKQYRKTIERDIIYIGGWYDSIKDQANSKPIQLVFQYHPADKKLCLSAFKLKRLAICVADIILHEVIHMKQFRTRGFKDLPTYPITAESKTQQREQQYLGNNDEIDAYSFNIACELNSMFNGSDKKIIKYLNSSINSIGDDNWSVYLKAFDSDHNHPVIKRVKKRVVYYLPYAKIGKPFKTTSRLIQ